MNEYGLLIKRENRYGTEYVSAEVVAREESALHPRGCTNDGEYSGDPKVPEHLHGLLLDGLCLYGHITEIGEPCFVTHGIVYRDCNFLDIPKAERAIKTLKRIAKRVAAEDASEPGDVFCAFYKALKLSFVVEQIGKGKGSSFAEENWHWMSMAAGRNTFRSMIAEAVAAEVERRGTKAA
jgi:hypothetical protein